jgi:predicted nucleotidyltransferase
MTVLESVRKRKDEIEAIAAKRGARDVRIFGSVARDEATPDSDIDLLVSYSAEASLLDQAA